MKLLLILIGIYTVNTHATFQIRDILYYEDKEYTIDEFPFDVFLKKDSSNSILKNNYSFSTACWRGYTATWEIIDSCLYIIDIRRCDGENDLVLCDILQCEKGISRADWYSGQIHVRHERGKRSIHGDPFVLINIVNGRVLNTDILKPGEIDKIHKRKLFPATCWFYSSISAGYLIMIYGILYFIFH